MVRINDHIEKIEFTKRELKRTKSYKRKKDLERSLARLEKDLYQCIGYLGGNYDK